MTDKQVEALRLADALDAAPYSCGCTMEAAEELRRLHSLNAELLEALKMNAQALVWIAFGECRGFHDSLPTALEASEAARAAIAKAEGKQ